MPRLLAAYWSTAALAATAAPGDGLLFLFGYLLRFLRAALLLSLWRVLFAGRGEVGGMALAQVLAYTLLAEALAEVLACRSRLAEAIWDGSLATRVLRPLPLVGQVAAEMLGRWSPGLLCFSLPLLLAAPLLGVDPRPSNLAAALCFPLSLVLSVTVGLALELLAAAGMVAWQQNLYAWEHARGAIQGLLSGSLLPLALLPWGLGGVFEWLPPAAMASAPLRVYTGTGDPLLLLLRQAGWAVLLWPLAGWAWRRSRESFSSYGG